MKNISFYIYFLFRSCKTVKILIRNLFFYTYYRPFLTPLDFICKNSFKQQTDRRVGASGWRWPDGRWMAKIVECNLWIRVLPLYFVTPPFVWKNHLHLKNLIKNSFYIFFWILQTFQPSLYTPLEHVVIVFHSLALAAFRV